MLSWFQEFNDEQRNIILKKILVRKCVYKIQEFGHFLESFRLVKRTEKGCTYLFKIFFREESL